MARYNFVTVSKIRQYSITHGYNCKDPFGHLESAHPQGRMTHHHQDISPEKNADDWSSQTEDEMVRGLFIQRGPSEQMTFEAAMKRYLA